MWNPEAVTVLAEEGSYQDIRFAEDGSHITYTKSTPLRTSYERGEGTEYAYFKQDWRPGPKPWRSWRRASSGSG